MEHLERHDIASRHGATRHVVDHKQNYEIFHEGRQVRVRLNRASEDRAIMIPLRNGFPLYAPDRMAQCFSVTDCTGRRVAIAIRFAVFGLRLTFDLLPASGDFFIRTYTPVGRA